ncbi:hypothetical protein C1645_741733 [Glomus cerebriforme]|uniref:Uncharacterized protein n=1 Tax=Glomus cerebriforme TaxID=658196 RepID=A0A397SGA7_9GLOM|nr:hypothetical protein C1645_741733 [Glomus cerebriforme]
MLQILELAREAASIDESNEKRLHQFNYTYSFHSSNDVQNNENDDNNKNKTYNILSYTREPISLPPPPSMSSQEQEKSSFQKHLEKHLQKLEKIKLENPHLEKLKRPKMYRNMSADAVPIDELPDILRKNKSNLIEVIMEYSMLNHCHSVERTKFFRHG